MYQKLERVLKKTYAQVIKNEHKKENARRTPLLTHCLANDCLSRREECDNEIDFPEITQCYQQGLAPYQFQLDEVENDFDD